MGKKGNKDIRSRDSKLIIVFSRGEGAGVKDCWSWGTNGY